MSKAEFVRDLPRTIAGAEQKLWSVDGRFVVSSAVDVFGQPETYLFYADGDGHITDFSELAGSFRGDMDHDRAIAGYLESLEPAQPKHTSDPKHLPPRDCQVWFQDEKDRAEGKAPYWMEVRFESADGETVYDDITPHTVWHPDQWRIPYSDEILDVADVITWRELPEVE